MSRRHLLLGSFGFTVAVPLRGALRAETLETAQGSANPHVFLTIRPDGGLQVTCHRSEMGQQTWNAMAQILAEELDMDWQRVTVVQGDGDPIFGDQNTDGSRSVRANFYRLRVAGAAMREVLQRAAAKTWECPTAQVSIRGQAQHRDGRTRSFADLVETARGLPLPKLGQLKLKPASQWKLIGAPLPSVTTPKQINGDGTYGMDVRLPNMRYAVIARPPQPGSTLETMDDTQARRVPGVEHILSLPIPKGASGFQPLGGVVVVARDSFSAIQGRKALKLSWKRPQASYNSDEFRTQLQEQARRPGEVRRDRGDVDLALESAHQKISADYYVPHLSHSPMEPPCATAHWQGDSVECWACVQTPQSARSEVASSCNVDPSQVTVHVTWLGGGFGRKSKPDFVAEAALVAREVQKPVKLFWTREDDTQHGYYHTVSAQHLEGGLNDKGECTAWLHRTVFPPIGSTFSEEANSPSWGELRLGASDTPFDIPHLRLETGQARAPVRIGWLRSVANIQHAFAVQSFAGELAHAAGRDPLTFLLELIGPDRNVDPKVDGAHYDNYGSDLREHPIDTRRLKAVLTEAAQRARYGRQLPKGHGLGIAVHRSFLTYVATVVEVAFDPQGVMSIPGVWSVMDAGVVVNPDHARSQLEGGTLFGLSNAMFGNITARDGVIEQRNFPDWRVMRMNEAPRSMEAHVVSSSAPPGGVGEPPTPPAAPALCNAIFLATGTRIRSLPIFGSNRDLKLEGETR